ncbi:AraC family transcriptional regulator [Sulfurospirillum sp.]|uniref:AraC family transcriptional regulator n=1 Tax=Sulfurospirillum sp. TaxID=2053622 RepID=UPI002FDD7D5D
MNETKTTMTGYREVPFLQIRRTLQSERAYESHAHPTLSIGFMMEGKTCFQTPHGSFLLEQGALAIIPPHTQHSCNPIKESKRSYVMVYLDAEFCARIQARHFKEASTLLPLTSPLIFHKALFEEFTRIIKALIEGYSPLHVKALEALLETFFWLYTKRCVIQETEKTLHDVVRFLESRIDEPLSLNDLAKRFGLNPFVLTRHFKQAYGCTPKHYSLDVRIDHAKKLLQGGTPLALCAQYCGFVDQSHFHHFFKRHTALTPKEYQVNFIQ